MVFNNNEQKEREKIMKKKLISVIAVMVCVSVFVTNVFAYPISPNTYKMTTTPTEDLTDEESVVWESTKPTEDFAYSPAICVTESGRVVVSYDISGEKGEVKYSDDGGSTWLQATMQDDAFLFARPFETESGLYLVARRYAASAEDGNGQLIMFKSEDNGQTWGDASVIDSGVWHSAPSEVVHLNGYIYMTWEAQDKAAAQATGGAGRGILAPVILRARETADLMVASNWTISDSEETYFSYYDAVGGNSYSKIDYMGIPFMHYRFGDNTRTMGWLEGNIVRIIDPSHVLYDENAFYIYLRSTANTSDYANLMKIVENEDGTMTSELVTTPSGKTNLYVQLPGGQSKFYITYDEQEELYWLVSNVSTDSMEIDTTFDKGADTSRHEGPQDVRNELGLYYSSNAMDWNFAGIVSATDSINQARSYPSMVIDGNDLLVVSRSGDEDAQSAHNTNLITFHKIKNFRRLANEALISEEQENLVYSPDVLNDSSVTDTHTYITENGTTLVACSISDETSTTSKVLVKQEDGTYVETLSTGYKLGELFEVDETIYVFGVADHKLVAFTSTNEGVAWNGPYAIETTRDWYEAPTSVIVNDEQIMLALSEITEGTWATLRGYNSEENGSLTYDEATGIADFNGYGATVYTEAFYLEEGDSLSFNVSPTTLVAANANEFGIAFLNAPTFFGNTDLDYADGFAINLKTNSDYTDGVFHAYTSYVSKGTAPNISVNTERMGAKGLNGGMLNNLIEVKFTKKTQTISSVDYAWELSFTYTDENSARTTLTKNIPADQVPADTFENGMWLSAGGRSGKIVQYKLSQLEVKKANSEVGNEKKWKTYTGTGYATETVVEDEDASVTITNKAAAYITDMIEVKEGTKISFDIEFTSISETGNIQGGFALTDSENNYFFNDVGNALGVEMSSVSAFESGAMRGAYTYTKNAKRTTSYGATAINQRADILGRTYSVTFEKQLNDSSYSWIISITDDKGYAREIPIEDSTFEDSMFTNGAYLIVGSPGNGNTFKVSNFDVSESTWTKYDEASTYTGQAVENEVTSVTIKDKAAAYTTDKIEVKEGTKISFDIEFTSISETGNIQGGFALTDSENNYFFNDVGNALGVEMSSVSAFESGAMRGAYTYTKNAKRTTSYGATAINQRADILGRTYSVTFEKQLNDSSYSWIISITDDKGYAREIPIEDSTFEDSMFTNGAYLIVGSNAAGNTMKVSNYKVEQILIDEAVVATTDVNNRYMATPVIMTASISSSLIDADSWTYYDGGKSFANKFVNAYANTKLNYFGLPYTKHDIRTVGWSNLKLFEVYETDDIRHDNQLNSGDTTGNLYGYMTLQNVGYDYAAFVKINTNTQKIEFFTPAGLNEEITEEEMVLSKMPGGNNGFEIFWDETSGLYWLVTTEDTDSTSDSTETRVAIYYGTNAYDWRSAGVVAELSGDARVSAVVEGEQLVITAINDDVVQYTVPNFRELVGFSGLGDWSQIKVRGTSGSYSIMENKNLIQLSNFGAATCNQKVDVAEGTQISFKVKVTTPITNQVFAVGLIDTYGSFPGRIDDTTYYEGNGMVASMATTRNDKCGAAIRYASVNTAKSHVDINGFNQEQGQSAAIPTTIDMTGNEITFTFTKRSQTINNVAYSWTIEWVEAKGNTTGSWNLKASDVPDNLFDNGAYIFAGCRIGGGAGVYEISDLTITQPVVGDVNHDGEINILDIAAIDYGIGVPASVASYEKHVYNVDKDENVEINYKDVNAIRADVLAH